MEVWQFIQQNALAIVGTVITGVGTYFGMRSYFLAERQKQNEEISRIKQLLVGSSEVSVQNLTDVIDTLRDRVDRLEEDRKRVQELLDSERKRAKRLEDEKNRLEDEVQEGRTRITSMEEKIGALKERLKETEAQLKAASQGAKGGPSIQAGWLDGWPSTPNVDAIIESGRNDEG